jgi:AMP phosphorylase
VKFRSKNVPIKAGTFYVAVFHLDDAKQLDLWPTDRIELKHGKQDITAIVDIAKGEEIVAPGTVALYYETSQKLKTKPRDSVEVLPMPIPPSVRMIKQKLEGKRLNYNQMYEIIKAISENDLTDTEMTYFLSASYLRGLSLKEVEHLTKAMVATGDILKPKKKPVFDKHSIGGIPGNRTTPLIVSIVAAAGLTIPKTSSRSITSPAGTADTMEVLCNVIVPLKKMKKIVDRVGACIVWGGALNLAPADDNIIKIEHPMSLDAEGNLLASILAKKLSVSSTKILIDIPVARDAKITTRTRANRLKKKFYAIAKHFGLDIKVIITDGSQPIGNGIGPALEARDVLWCLTGHPRAPLDLIRKSVWMSGLLLEMGGKAKQGQGIKKAVEILNSGAAYKKFCEILRAQGAKITDPDKIPLGKFTRVFRAGKSGRITDVDNKKINPLARMLGAPVEKGAGIYLYKNEEQSVKKGEKLFKIYADSRRKFNYGVRFLKKYNPYTIK